MLTIAVIGAGHSGRDFALRCAAAGFAVVLEDVMPDKLRNATQAFAALGLEIRTALSVDDAVREADVAIDFVPDELESKLEIWSMIDRMAPPKTMLCTPSEVLSITDLASCTYRADRCVMIRGAVAGTALHLLTAAETSAATLASATAFLAGLGYEVHTEADPDLPQLMKNMRLVL